MRTLLASGGRVAAAAFVLIVAAGAAGAQTLTVTPNDPRPSYGWTLTPVFVFSQATDSNVTLAGKDAVNTGDEVASLSPSGELGYLSPVMALTAGYAGSAVRHFSLDQLNTFDQRLYANVKRLLSRRLQVFGQASAGWMPTTDTVLLAGVPFLRVGSTVKTLQGGILGAVAKHTTMTVGYRLEYIDFDRSNPLSSQLLGGHTNGVFGDLRQQVSRRMTVGVAYDIRRAVIANGLQRFDMVNGEGLVEYVLSPAAKLSGGVGVARISGSLPAEPLRPGQLPGQAPLPVQDTSSEQGARVGPSWHVGLDYRIEPAFAFATYRRSYVPSYGIGGTMQNEELATGVRVPIALRDRLVLNGSVSWRRNEPLELELLRPLSSFWLNAGASYAFAPWLRLEGFFARSSQDSHLAGGIVERHQLGVQVVALAPMRFK